MSSVDVRNWFGLRPSGLRVLVLLGMCFATAAFSQNTNSPSNRWLLVVETSRAMQSRAEAARDVAAGLIASGVNGQVRPGDTLGVWTFNESLYAGGFPLQEFTTPQSRQAIARRVSEYLRGQGFANVSRLERIIPQLNRLVEESEFITVLLISEGSSPITGTPFDDAINAHFRSWKRELDARRMPFVTVLRGKGGTLTEYAVNTPPFPLEMPPLPDELLKPRVPEPAPVVQAEKPQPKPVVPSLYFSGRKPETLVTQATAAVVAPAEPAKPMEVSPVEQRPVAVETPASNPAPVTASVADPVRTETPVIAKADPEPPVAPPTRTPAAESGNAVLGTTVLAREVTNTTTMPAAQAAAAPAAASEPGNTRIIIAASIGLTLGMVFFLMLRWRAAQRQQASLITRSLDRESR